MTRLQGKYTQAQTLLETALTLATELGIYYEESLLLASLARLHGYLGNEAGAQPYQQRLTQLLATVTLPKECHMHSLLASALLAHYTEDHPTALRYAEQAQQTLLPRQILNRRADTFVVLGHARAGMGQWAAAAAAYEQTIAWYRTLGSAALAVEPQAGLAQLALAQGNMTQAQTWVEEILPILVVESRAGLNTPFFAYLTCYRVLATNADPRAVAVLQTAYDLLHQYAASIHEDTLRRSFLEEVAIHRALQQAYTKTPEKVTNR